MSDAERPPPTQAAKLQVLTDRVELLTEAVRILLSAPVNSAISKDQHTRLLAVRSRL